jgi:hypothetical protein
MAKQRLSDPINVENMYRKGESFHFAARYIQRGGLQAMGGGWCAWPTNMAFACEAYLKVLAQLERNEPPYDTHNLRDLFHDVLPATQRELRRKWLKANGSMLKQKALPPPIKIKNAKTFEEALDLSAKAFVDWRYNDENPNHWQLGSLPEIVREHLLTMKPDWRPYKGLLATILNPHADFVKPEDNIRASVPLPGFANLNRKAAPIRFTIRRSTDPKDGSSG